MRKGTINDIITYPLNKPCIHIIESIYPRNVEPVSPINIFAGLKLYGKNPRQEPASAAAKIATTGSPARIAIKNRENVAIEETQLYLDI